MRVCGSATPAHRSFFPLTRPQNAPAIIRPPAASTFVPVPVPRTFYSNPISRGLIQSFHKQRWKLQSHERRADHGEGEEEVRPVHCEVEVISWRERRIRATVLVQVDMETVWGVLTDYERLADFIPNLIYSGRIPCPHQGKIWLEQRGLQRALYWHIEARVVLDLQESTNLDNERELQFTMVDGDFKKFEGKWSVKTGQR